MKKYLLILCFYTTYQIYYSYWFFDTHNKFKNKIKNEIIKN